MTPPNLNAGKERPAESVSGMAAVSTAQIINLTELQPQAGDAGDGLHAGEDGGNPLHQVKATVTVCVGSAVMTVGELLAARKDQVLRLDCAIHDPVELLVAGKVVARGQLIAVDDHFGVRITQIPQALQV